MAITFKQFSPEIQGLRAISIIAVILFHFQSRWLPGGYVGVDVFFVISGFLITRMIVGGIGSGGFSLARFYRNRVIRLLPNLFLMVVVSTVISYFVLQPYDFFQYAKSLQFSAIYLTNMVFARQQGYFDMSRDAKPLLHTWSLSIEEQFYLIFPLLLLMLYKLKSYRISVLIAIALASFWVRYDTLQQHLPVQSFFSFPGRIWEFVVGALIVWLPDNLKTKLAGNGLAAMLGLLFILAALLFLDESLPHSGLLLLIPCIATALVIASSEGTLVSKWLGNPRLVFIGGLSYSLYLWHWPLIVWIHNADFELSSGAQTLLLLGLTAVVSYLAWRFVEEPFRRNRERYSGKFVTGAVLVYALYCIVVGSYVYAKNGMEMRFPAWVAVKNDLESFDFKSATGHQVRLPAACVIGDDPQQTLQSCAFGDMNAKSRFLLLGDSHSGAAYPAFQAAAEARHAQGVWVMLAGCPPVFGITSLDGAKDVCAEKFDERVGALIATGAFSKVFLVAHWSRYSEGDPDNQPNHFISDRTTISRDAASSKRVLSAHLRQTISRMQAQDLEVVVMRSVPIMPKIIQRLPQDYMLPLSDLRAQQQFLTDFSASQANLQFLDPTPALCDAAKGCYSHLNGHVLYVDDNHISRAGAARLVGLIEPLL